MNYQIIKQGESRSFSPDDAFVQGASNNGNILVVLGSDSPKALENLNNRENAKAILVELGTECLGVHTGESAGKEGSNVIGFSRFRLGDAEPSNLVEVVRQPNTDEEALAVAIKLLEDAGLEVAVCNDFAGRIIDRLVRPYYNEALKRLDEGLATANDLDLTLKLGLGYPEGPISLLERTGLAHHYDVTKALFEIYGERAYAPARRATVSHQRRKTHQD